MSSPEAVFSLVSNNLCSAQILIVEDNTSNRLLLGDYLIYSGYTVCSLANGSNFFLALEQVQPDLVLLDLKLPDVDGYTLLHQMQQSSVWRQVPVVVVSAFAFRAEQQRALALGARHYLVKPIDLNSLKRVVSQELRHLA